MVDHNTNLHQNIHFFNKWASSYDHSLFQFWMKKFHVPILRELKNKKGISVLDISCGTGQLLHSLHQQSDGNIHLIGVDISKDMLRAARTKLPRSVTLYHADVHHLPFKDNTFDYVLSTEAFHHYYDQEKALQEMKRVAKKNGNVIVADVRFFFPFIHWLFQKLEPGCIKINTKKEMKKLFEHVGLTHIKQQRYFAFSMTTSGIK
ncbi:MAG: class I SAM-dependent methyltransferase [Nanoarchaeota archaeon]|nr:class I SAM-dependent methyltransferase [Nanoarchaeota archaeon]